MTAAGPGGDLTPILVLSFNRPDYLEPVLRSLAAQADRAMERHPVFLFQDHPLSRLTGAPLARPEDVAACLDLFARIIPWGTAVPAGANLGVALNVRRAERFAFETLDAEVAYFLEDDLILSPLYLSVLDRMRDLCAPEPRIGYFACYGEHRADPALQAEKSFRLMRLGHHWGFGLFRRHWREIQPLLEPFHTLVEGVEYRARPHAAILEHYRSRGILAKVSSQDEVKQAVGLSLGRIGLNTFAVYGRYVGARGEHMTPEGYALRGYGGTAMLDHPPPRLRLPTAEVIAEYHRQGLEHRRQVIAANP